MMRSSLITLCVATVLVFPVAAQEKKAGEKSNAKNPAQATAKSDDATPGDAGTEGEAASDDAKSDDPAVAEFDKMFGEWKELLSKLQDLRARYIATPRKGNLRQPIKAEFEEVVKQGEELEPKVIKAAEAAFAAVRNKRPDVGQFLATYLKHYVESDDYEAAVPVARALIENEYDNPRIFSLGGIAALFTEDFDAAEKWLKEGETQSLLDVRGKQSLAHLEQSREKWEAESEIRQKEKQADDLPRVLLKTSQGDVTVELFENEAPNTVANFISLVEKKFYDGLAFHRVIPHFMAQGGDPNGDGSGGPGYQIADEVDNPNHRKHFRGSLSMAKTDAPDTGGSQFFLCFVATDHLDGKHTVFGRVIDGMDVLARIRRTEAPPDKQDQFTAPTAKQLDRIVEAVVLRKRKHEYVPKKVGDEPPAKSDADKDDDAKGDDAKQ
ncbi:MAG TPA: peptidylprolyl isomerase [Pirellulales bacterium]|nr:peptidylprolyl isomerase [Pirellulales bacterium]